MCEPDINSVLEWISVTIAWWMCFQWLHQADINITAGIYQWSQLHRPTVLVWKQHLESWVCWIEWWCLHKWGLQEDQCRLWDTQMVLISKSYSWRIDEHLPWEPSSNDCEPWKLGIIVQQMQDMGATRHGPSLLEDVVQQLTVLLCPCNVWCWCRRLLCG